MKKLIALLAILTLPACVTPATSQGDAIVRHVDGKVLGWWCDHWCYGDWEGE